MLALSVKTYYYIINALCQDRLHGMNKSAQKMVRKGAFFAMTERNLTMLTDFYEFTMANGYFEKGIGNRRAYFDMFFRRVPDGGGYAIMAGVEQLIEYFNNLHFSEEDIAYLRSRKCFSESFLNYLRDFEFECDVWAVPEGTPVFPGEPLVTVAGPMIQAQFVETMILLTINHQTLIATKANRITRAAEGRTVLEFGSRRAQGYDGAILGARAAYIGGCQGTACVLSDRDYKIPAGGTMAHSWVQMFDSEYEAFKAYADIYPDNCVFLVDTYNVLKSGVPNAIRVAKELEADMKELAQEELQQAKSDIARMEDELKILLLPKDPNDEKNIYVEIRGGAGGEESALFAADLYRMYTMYADKRGWQTEVMNKSETELGGYKEIVFRVAGDKVYSRLKFESGVHRVQRVPETESQGRVHTSTTTVAVLPEAEELDFYIDPKDLRIDTFRASGAGGQHINKTSSAIRVTHIPTNTVVECQDERSQHKNKDKALSVLRSRLYEAEVEKQRAAIAADRKSQVGTGDRSERIRTYNFPENRVSDHRIKLTIYKLDQFLNGDMDEILDALIAADTAEKLKEQSEM